MSICCPYMMGADDFILLKVGASSYCSNRWHLEVASLKAEIKKWNATICILILLFRFHLRDFQRIPEVVYDSKMILPVWHTEDWRYDKWTLKWKWKWKKGKENEKRILFFAPGGEPSGTRNLVKNVDVVRFPWSTVMNPHKRFFKNCILISSNWIIVLSFP